MALARAEAQHRRRIERMANLEMFSPTECGVGNDYHQAGLRHRYRAAAHNLVEQKLRSNRRRPISYEEA
jgi:hypothetical protein